ncbi:MAG TPA: quinohemoprotein amine dehydrogenase subunit gamma [Vicinamibacterales bacterium]|nr:quinohemoprotein amine dehydrogenase subunit gamma [Vicinamibacterales bacterium]
MKHLSPVNDKARRVMNAIEPGAAPAQAGASLADASPKSSAEAGDVVALQQPRAPQQPPGPHIPLGCATIFSPGWEVDRTGGTAGLCQPVERDLFDCHFGCYWPAQVPDQLNHAPTWTGKCAAAQKDWRKIDLIFP